MSGYDDYIDELEQIIAAQGIKPGIANGLRNKLKGMKTGHEKFINGLKKDAEKKKEQQIKTEKKGKKTMSDADFTFDEKKFQEDLKTLFGDALIPSQSYEELKAMYAAGKGTFPSSLDKDKYTMPPVAPQTKNDDKPKEETTTFNEGTPDAAPASDNPQDALGDYAKIINVYKQWCEIEDPKHSLDYKLNDDGTLNITIEPTEAQKTADPEDKGAKYVYLSPKEVCFVEKDGVQPADQGYEYFLKAIDAQIAVGSKTIEFGTIETQKFATKLMAATMEKGLRIANPPKEISLDKATTKGVSPETLKKMSAYALQNGIKINGAENQPIDFTQDFIKNLPEAEQYKVLATAIRSGMKIENGPTQLKLTKEMIGGTEINKEDGKPATYGEVETGYLSKEDQAALRQYQIALVKDKMSKTTTTNGDSALTAREKSREPGKTRNVRQADGTLKKLKVLTPEEKTAALARLKQTTK